MEEIPKIFTTRKRRNTVTGRNTKDEGITELWSINSVPSEMDIEIYSEERVDEKTIDSVKDKIIRNISTEYNINYLLRVLSVDDVFDFLIDKIKYTRIWNYAEMPIMEEDEKLRKKHEELLDKINMFSF